MGHPTTAFFLHFAKAVPLPVFVFFGGIVDEVIAFIPSGAIFGAAGIALGYRGAHLGAILVCIVFAALGKAVGATLWHWAADKAEDFVTQRWGPKIGLDHAAVERIGAKLSKKGWRERAIVAALMSVPLLPTAPVSVACGFIKIPRSHFFVAAFCGFLIRATIMVVAGFNGFRLVEW